MTQNKNRLFGRHFETVQHFTYLFIYLFIFAELSFFIARTYMVQISLQNSSLGKWFSQEGSMEPPLATNGSKSTLVT